MGYLRMNPVIHPQNMRNLWDASGLLLQKMPAEEFTATTKLAFRHHHDGERTGPVGLTAEPIGAIINIDGVMDFTC